MRPLKRILTRLLGNEPNKEEIAAAQDGEEQEMVGDLLLESENSVTISLYDSPCSLYDSKVGGVPYLPDNFDYPMDLREGRKDKPLAFLAQINFAQLPPLDGFPKYGILQFYIGSDCIFGLDLEHPTDEAGFRVVYHEMLLKEDRLLKKIPFKIDAECLLPVMKELKMGFTPEESVIGFSDFRFDGALLDAYKTLNPLAVSVEDIPSEILDKMDVLCNASGSRIGGFPLFTQSDPRQENDWSADYSVLLFQLDSDSAKQIAWGDQGVGNFFIRPKDLANLDFSKVLYNWDCY